MNTDRTPSIITSLKPGMTITCGPHRTPFTATGFAWCYGYEIGETLYGIDFRTGGLQMIETILPGFTEFTIYAEDDDGYELLQLQRQRSVLMDANDAAIAMQAMFSNRVTIEMAFWGACGASPEIARRTAFDTSDAAGCKIKLTDDRHLSEVRGLTKPVEVMIAPLAEGAWGYIDPERKILWIEPPIAPLIDCPALMLDAIIRSQIAAAFPGDHQSWVIVSRRAGSKMIKASRDRAPSPSFICEPHARDVYLPDQTIDVDTQSISLSIDDGVLITDTDDWHYHFHMKLIENHMIVRFDGQCWSHLASRPERRAQIAAAIRHKFRTNYQITLTGFGD